MVYSSKKLYQLDGGYVDRMKTASRHLSESSDSLQQIAEESSLEKPYQSPGYQNMHQYPDLEPPGDPGEDPEIPVKGFT